MDCGRILGVFQPVWPKESSCARYVFANVPQQGVGVLPLDSVLGAPPG
jgi:hypothetical protein